MAETENKSLEAEKPHWDFRQSEDFYERLLESLREYAVFTTDLKGVITSWNKGAEKVLGYSREEILGQSASSSFIKRSLTFSAACIRTRNTKVPARASHIVKRNSILLCLKS